MTGFHFFPPKASSSSDACYSINGGPFELGTWLLNLAHLVETPSLDHSTEPKQR
jgi:hypothetical protein